MRVYLEKDTVQSRWQFSLERFNQADGSKLGNRREFLIHWFVIERLVNIMGINTKSIVYRIGGPWVIMLIVIGITWIMRKVPLIKWI